jgi:hypothetical protein
VLARPSAGFAWTPGVWRSLATGSKISAGITRGKQALWEASRSLRTIPYRVVYAWLTSYWEKIFERRAT